LRGEWVKSNYARLAYDVNRESIRGGWRAESKMRGGGRGESKYEKRRER